MMMMTLWVLAVSIAIYARIAICGAGGGQQIIINGLASSSYKPNDTSQCVRLKLALGGPAHLMELPRFSDGSAISVDQPSIVNVTYNVTLNALVIVPVDIGRTRLVISSSKNDSKSECFNLVLVIEKKGIDRLFDFLVIILVCVMSLLTGMLLDIDVVKKRILTTPITLIGCCMLQYTGLPLIMFALCKLLKFRPLVSTALFTIACSPISTKGNHWSIMFDADIELSVCLTFLSTILSLVAMPAWMYSLGQVYTQHRFKIPVLMLGRSILTLLVPYILGVLMNGLVLKAGEDAKKEKLRRYAKILLLIAMLFFVTVGVYVSFPLFKLLTLREALVIPTFQWAGGLTMFLLALIKLPIKQAEAIGLTCCYPNIGLAFLVVRHNLPAPETHIASAVVLIVAATGGAPLWILYPIRQLILLIKNRHHNRRTKTVVYQPVLINSN